MASHTLDFYQGYIKQIGHGRNNTRVCSIKGQKNLNFVAKKKKC